MKVGLIARADERGIRYQCEEFHRHMRPDKTLVVFLNDPLHPEDAGLYQGDNVFQVQAVGLRRHFSFDERTTRKFLEGLDVVFSVETVYDWNLITWARQMGVRTVIQGNPEFYTHHHEPDRPVPDKWVWPTDWLWAEPEMPGGQIVPVPCVERPPVAGDPDDDVLRVLHVAGHAAAADRNGTVDFMEAVTSLRSRCEVTVVGQDGWLPQVRKVPTNVTLVEQSTGVQDRWEMYRNKHLVVLPRRYGGLCLPALEAMASGCAILMPDCSPNDTWPGARVKARKGYMHRTPFGHIQTHAVHPLELAQHIDRHANVEYRRKHQEEARNWAELNSWRDLKPLLYDPLMEGT